MLFPVGLIVVFGSVIVGYKMHHGDLALLWQPNELVIILGSGIGSLLIANPIATVKKVVKSFKYLFKGAPYNKKDYMDLLLFSFNTYKLMKVKGMLEIESHLEKPEESELFKSATSLKKFPIAFDFVRDNLRVLTMGVENPHQFEDAVEKEIEVFTEDSHAAGKAITSLADALPALGIVAAVLGVIITMRSIMEPPDVLGSLIAAALVGTFIGVLLSYGLFNPIGTFLTTFSDSKMRFISCIKTGFICYLNGHPPIVIVEFMRKSIPDDTRPSFEELDEYINNNATKAS